MKKCVCVCMTIKLFDVWWFRNIFIYFWLDMVEAILLYFIWQALRDIFKVLWIRQNKKGKFWILSALYRNMYTFCVLYHTCKIGDINVYNIWCIKKEWNTLKNFPIVNKSFIVDRKTTLLLYASKFNWKTRFVILHRTLKYIISAYFV